MIDPKAVPIDNRNPYKRVDLAARRRPRTITREELYKLEFVPNLERDYWCDPMGTWHLHEDQ